jgi:glycosyltransferase involved in cell wall biosynthesis
VSSRTIKVVRIISRLNIGGPAVQAVTLTALLEPLGYETTLVRGSEDPDEGSMDYLADQLGVRPVLVASMRRNVGAGDVRALAELRRILARERPDVVHTHAAKAGTLGRVATLIVTRRGRRPVLVHTYHGHSLSGYFSTRRNALFKRIETFLGHRTDRLVAVSEEVRDELVGFGVAEPEDFEVVRVGFDLSRFRVDEDERAARRRALRNELGLPESASVVTLVARLVPIKRVDRFLRVARGLAEATDARFLIVGDGELRKELRSSPEAHELDGRVVWAGFRRDMPDVYFASDVVVQTSDNEGTPVALIEAQAAGVAVVSTRVGGVSTVVLEGRSGRIVAVDDEHALTVAVQELVADGAHARALGARGQDHVMASFSIDRLVADIDTLYRGLLSQRRGPQ